MICLITIFFWMTFLHISIIQLVTQLIARSIVQLNSQSDYRQSID
jgi:hypothetical protein